MALTMPSPGSPFARVAASLIEQGYSPVVIIPGEKRPGKLIQRDGERRWVGDFEWQRYCDRQPTEFEIGLFSRWPDGGVGIAHGRASGGIVGIDLDDDTFGCHTDILNALDSLGGTPVGRRGARGQMRYARGGPGVQSWIPKIGKEKLFELLGHGRQSLVPPTIHPETRQPYYWVTSDTLEDTPVRDLPLVTIEWLRDAIEPILRNAGWEPELPPADPATFGDGWWSDINSRSLINPTAWVPDLGLPKLKRTTQGYTAVPAFRPSGRNRPEHERDNSLGIHPDGIKDFGTGETYSPLDLVARCLGVSDERAVEWLAARVVPVDAVAAASQAALAAKAPAAPTSGLAAVEAADDALDTIDRIPQPAFKADALAHLLVDEPFDPRSLGGVLGQISSHILSTALFPVPEFATMASVVFGAGLFGRRWQEPLQGNGINLYVLATAPSGWGKDHPIRRIPDLAYECGAGHLIGPDEFASDAAIEKVLRNGPCRSCFMDEIGVVLQSLASRQAGSWERRIRKALLSLYSASRSSWTGRQAAGDEIDKGREPVWYPTLSLYGASTPQELYKGLTEDNIADGLFGRILFVAPDDKPDINDGAELTPIPPEVKSCIADVLEYRPDGAGDLYSAAIRSATIKPYAVRVRAEPAALQALNDILEWQRLLAETEEGLEKIANRAGENAGKLATIRALSRSHTEPLVRLDDVSWGWTIVNSSLRIITRDMERYMTGSEFEGLVKAIRRHVEEAGKQGTTLSELIRKRGVSRAHHRDVNAALKMLQDAGDVVMERVSARARGFRIRAV